MIIASHSGVRLPRRASGDSPAEATHLGLIACLVLVASAGCGPFASHEPAAKPVSSVTLLAAASTAEAVQQIAEQFESDTGMRVTISTGPSSGLARQIIAGAPAEVFLSASPKWADSIQQQDLAAEVIPLLTSQMVLIVPRGNPAEVTTLRDLLSPNVTKVALAGEAVPAGTYATQALKTVRLYDRLEGEGKIVRGHDVRVTLAYVESGEAEAGVVYATDAHVSSGVEVVAEVDPRTHDRVVYVAVLLASASDQPASRRFFQYLRSPAALDVFERNGFARLAESANEEERPAR